jgi:hypothetical protein
LGFKRQSVDIVKELEKGVHREKDNEFRSKNVIIFGIEEIGDRDKLCSQVTKLLSDCHLDITVTNDNMYRLGKIHEADGNIKRRPVRLIASSETQKWELLKRINSLKYEGIFARLDLSKEDQQKDLALRTELKEVRSQDQAGRYVIRKGKIVKLS